MIVAIVGSRDYLWPENVREYVNRLGPQDIVVSGGARGVDTWAVDAARARGLPVMVFQAHWDLYGKKAGFMRNTEIVLQSDRVVAFWDGKSRGTLDTICKALDAGKPVEIVGT